MSPAPVPPGVYVAFGAVVGACLGSFLNVVVARVPAGESIVSPGSRCPSCRRPIAARDNVPILSWLLLRGRCRGCAKPISLRYPLVEAAGLAAGAAAVLRHGPTATAGAEVLFALLLLALALIDLDTWSLPYELTVPLLVLGLVAAGLGLAPAPTPASASYGALIGFGGFWALALVAARVARREALGFGDVVLLGGIGAWLGAGALLPVVLLSSVQGSVVGIALVVLGRAQKGEEGGGAALPDGWTPPRNAVPFGPFLVLGALEWLYGSGPLSALAPALAVFR